MTFKYTSVIEQLVLSGGTFAINLYLIAVLSKTEYGLFATFYSYVFLALGVQIAVISTPIIVEFSSHPNKKKLLASSLQLIIKLILTLSLFIVFVFYLLFGFQEVFLGLMFVFAVSGTLVREFARTKYLLNSQLIKSLLMSSLYVFLLFMFFIIFHMLDFSLTLPYAFLLIGLASLFVSYDLYDLYSLKNSKLTQKYIVKKIFPHARWALPGVITIWLQNNAILTIVTIRAGADVTAELSAARLLIMPYVSGFSGYLRPKTSEFSRAKNKVLLFKHALKISFVQVLIGILLSIAFYILYKTGLLDSYLPDGYSSILLLAIFWALFAGISMGRGVLTILAQASKLFKVLFFINIFSVSVVMLVLIVSASDELFYMSIISLIAGEIIIFLLICIYFHFLGESHALSKK